LNPQNCLLTQLSYGDGGNYTGSGNIAGNPLFVSPYNNVLTSATVLDEAGNNISVRFTPLIPNSGNYHVGGASLASEAGAAINFGTFPALAMDFDGQPRSASTPDIGADEIAGIGGGLIYPIIDFNGDLRSDLVIYRDSTGTWHIYPSGGGTPYWVAWGQAGDIPVAGDYDGDGRTDPAVYRDGVWYIVPSTTGTVYAIGWGISTDTPVPGDYDGDGITDPAVYRDGGWYIYPSGGGAAYSVGWGISTDTPVPGDYDGDGITDPAVYRDGGWYIYPSGGGAAYSVGWGISTDIPVPGDYDGDGITDPAVYRDGTWYIYPSGGGAPYSIQWGGDPSDIPVTLNPALY
jgi:hypothetical protein